MSSAMIFGTSAARSALVGAGSAGGGTLRAGFSAGAGSLAGAAAASLGAASSWSVATPAGALQAVRRTTARPIGVRSRMWVTPTFLLSAAHTVKPDVGKTRKGAEAPESVHRRKARSKQEQAIARLVGRRIKELRNDRGWAQVDLEEHLDGMVKRATLSDYETGRELPSLRTIVKLAEAFEVDPAELLLNINGNERHRIAGAVLRAEADVLPHVARLLAVD